MDGKYTFIGGPADGLKIKVCGHYKEFYYYNSKNNEYDIASYFKEEIVYETGSIKNPNFKYYEYFRYSCCTIDFCLNALINNYKEKNSG